MDWLSKISSGWVFEDNEYIIYPLQSHNIFEIYKKYETIGRSKTKAQENKKKLCRIFCVLRGENKDCYKVEISKDCS